jgi:RNA polymerase subunit RPABC4/transcription elongation factor Spt4
LSFNRLIVIFLIKLQGRSIALEQKESEMSQRVWPGGDPALEAEMWAIHEGNLHIIRTCKEIEIMLTRDDMDAGRLHCPECGSSNLTADFEGYPGYVAVTCLEPECRFTGESIRFTLVGQEKGVRNTH